MNENNIMNKEAEDLREQLKRQEKLSSLGMLTAGIVHEIKNPLNFIINFSKVSESILAELKEILHSPSICMDSAHKEDIDNITLMLTGNLHKISEHGTRALNTIQSILLYSRDRNDTYMPADVSKLTSEYIKLSYHAMRAGYTNFNVSLTESYEPDMPLVKLIPQDFSRVVLNLMNNACYAVWHKSQHASTDYAPAIRISLCCSKGYLVFEIEDNGEGMDTETSQKLYEAFYTTKPAGHGTGLGMTIVREIVEQKHRGCISFDSRPGEFTRFTIKIPLDL